MDLSRFKYLPKIDSPRDLKKLSESDLQSVADEVREYMIDTITKTGGHFGAGLGVVELTSALHYVYDSPKDKIIFDVGHQGYPHKILTGRRDYLDTIRQKGGLSGFLKRSESVHDVFGAGHASTSISAALGMATARDLKGEDHSVVAVIGDGSLTGGLAYEAMNNCGVQNRDITVIINDNNVSIDSNVFAFSNYFNELYASGAVNKLRKNVWEFAGKFDQLGDRIRKVASKIEDGMKAIVTPGVLFEALGFNYFGPINGHNIPRLVKMFRSIKDLKGPILLHVITQKGKGYGPAEKDRHYLHAIGKIDRKTGKSLVSGANKAPSYSNIFGAALTKLCESDKKIIGITAAMGEGTGLDILEKTYPKNFADVGIAEGHAVTYAAGLASEGMKPVCAIYSSFLQRAYDQIMHDCALQNLHVVFAIDRAGIVGADGPTHHGTLDLAFLRSIPKMVVAAPKDEIELRDMLYSALYHYTTGPVAIRYPRGRGLGLTLREMRPIKLGRSETLRSGLDLAIVAIGKTVNYSLEAAELLAESGISAEVVNARFEKPLDEEAIEDLASRFDLIMTVEDGQMQGGFGSAVSEFLTRIDSDARLTIHGIPDKFVEHGSQSELFANLKLDAQGIALVAKKIVLEAELEKERIFALKK